MPEKEPLVVVRIDRWLVAARIFKSRELSQQACNGGHVQINGNSVKPSTVVRVGDRVRALAPRGETIVVVSKLEEKRQGPVLAKLLYVDESPPPPPKDETAFARPHGAGRPTKQDRRRLERFRGGF